MVPPPPPPLPPPPPAPSPPPAMPPPPPPLPLPPKPPKSPPPLPPSQPFAPPAYPVSPPLTPDAPNKAALMWEHLDDVDAARRSITQLQLYSLELTAQPAKWYPPFDPPLHNYKVYVAPTEHSTMLLPIVKVEGMRVTVNGVPTDNGGYSSSVALSYGETLVDVVVTGTSPFMTHPSLRFVDRSLFPVSHISTSL